MFGILLGRLLIAPTKHLDDHLIDADRRPTDLREDLFVEQVRNQFGHTDFQEPTRVIIVVIVNDDVLVLVFCGCLRLDVARGHPMPLQMDAEALLPDERLRTLIASKFAIRVSSVIAKNVLVSIALLSERSAAQIARVRSLARVHSHVQAQFGSLGERLTAVFALVRSSGIARMRRSQVESQRLLIAQSLAALAALKSSSSRASRVSDRVVSEVRRLTESLATLGTLVRLLARVRSSVDLQEGTLSERLTAFDAFMRLLARVNQPVSSKSVGETVALVAVRTCEGLLLVGRLLRASAVGRSAFGRFPRRRRCFVLLGGLRRTDRRRDLRVFAGVSHQTTSRSEMVVAFVTLMSRSGPCASTGFRW